MFLIYKYIIICIINYYWLCIILVVSWQCRCDSRLYNPILTLILTKYLLVKCQMIFFCLIFEYLIILSFFDRPAESLISKSRLIMFWWRTYDIYSYYFFMARTCQMLYYYLLYIYNLSTARDEHVYYNNNSYISNVLCL